MAGEPPRLWMVVIVTDASCSDAGDAQVSMAINPLNARDIARVTLAVSGPGMSPASGSLVLVGTTWQGTISPLPVGAERTCVGSALDANNNVVFRGAATVNITGASTAVVMLQVDPMALPRPITAISPWSRVVSADE